MVEKDTQRSRGFGFVSYDTVESADLAIKFMDGYQVGMGIVGGVSSQGDATNK